MQARQMSIKVPEITIYFWVIKILCVTVGETAADFIEWNLNVGLTNTTFIMGIFLALSLFIQFRSKKLRSEHLLDFSCVTEYLWYAYYR